MDSNHRPHAYQACALTSWAIDPYVVEIKGFEPLTPCVQGRCSPNWAISPHNFEHNRSKLNRIVSISNSCTKKHLDSSFLHRKEVIQPQVLLRLPCYDFTPIADPTLGRFLPCGLDHVLWVLPTLMVWRAVCTRPGNVFTATCWFAITSNSSFM